MAIDKNADFTPSIPDSGAVPTKLPYNPTGSFKFWAQKVLPLVYDDSLSYYEVLCKVVAYLNNVIQNVDNLNDSVNSTNQSFETLKGYVNTTKDTLINTYNELQDYVNTYFDNLDVQEEINAKLDAMADSGELTNLLAPFIPDLVTQWLNTHVTPTSPIIDNTLTISGAGADAKVTGDKFTDLKEELNQNRSATVTDDIFMTDEFGNIGARIEKGFNSSDTLRKDDTPDWSMDGSSAFSLVDNNGNIAVALGNMQPRFVSNLTGKFVSVLGDSISTYDAVGYKMPAIEDDHTQFYPRYNVNSLDKMWFSIVCKTIGAIMLKSASWGGSMVSGTGSVADGKPGWSDARIAALADGGTIPDIVLVEMGTNDFETGKEIGNFNGSSTLPETIQTGGTFSDAYALMLSKIHASYPLAKIVCITIPARKSVNDAPTINTPEYPVINRRGLCIDDYNNAIRNIAHYMNCAIADTYACGINPWNIPLIESGASYGTILGDRFIHPNVTGMNMIAESVVNTLRKM